MSWESAILGFKSYLTIERSLSANSVDAYIRDIKKLADFAKEKEKTELQIERSDLSEFISNISKSGVAARSQSRIISGIKAFYKYLIMEDYITANPTELLESPKIGMKLPDTLSIKEIDKLIAAIDLSKAEGERNRAMLEILYSCGLRVTELITLKLSNVSFVEGFIKVVSPIEDTPAYNAGVQAGDYIIRIDDSQVQGKTLMEAVNLMRGPVGTPIEITIRRKGEKKLLY